MADNIPETSVQSELISAGLNPSNPAMTTVDFANSMTKARQDQAAQEQAVALAREHVKQAQFQTATEAPDSMTPEEARAYLQIIAESKGLSIDAATIDKWIAQLPAHVNRQIVEAFANRFARESVRKGDAGMFEVADRIALPAGATAADVGLVPDEKDPEHFGHVPQDGMYQAWVDNQGVVKKYTPGGKEPVDPSIKAGQHSEDQNRKDWKALNDHIDTAFKTRSGGLGSLITAVYRADRALNTLNATGTLTAQDIANVSQDIAGIYQGGAPTVVSSKENNYDTIFSNLANMVRHITGAVINVNGTLNDTRQKLIDTVTTLRESSIENFKKWMDSQAAGYKAVIKSSPDTWEEMKKEKSDAVMSGLVLTADEKAKSQLSGTDVSIAPKSAFKKATDAVTGMFGSKDKKVVPKYTVEEDGK